MIRPKQIHSVGASSGDVLTFDGSAVAWAAPSGGGGGTSFTYSSRAASFTAAASQHNGLYASSGPLTVTLPQISGAGAPAGTRIRFKLVDNTNSVTLTPASGETIDGAATYVMSNPRQAVELVSDGTSDWQVF